MKCAVSGCRNSSVNVNPGIFKSATKRFFDFPKDPARVKIWLAALRETDKVDPTEEHRICEDHFLPEDITLEGVKPGAIPIMPPCLEESLIGPLESSAEEEEEEEEEDESGAAAAAPVPSYPQREPGEIFIPPAEPATTSSAASFTNPPAPLRAARQDLSLGTLTRGFLELLHAAQDQCVDISQAIASLQTRRRRIYDITNCMEGVGLLERKSKNKFKWIGRCEISQIKNAQKLKALEELKQTENSLDNLIKSCARQLFDMTDNTENATWAYVTREDISRLPVFSDQTVIVVKSPEDTKLEIPAPKEDGIEVHLKAVRAPIMVLTSEVESRASVTSDLPDKSKRFLQLEESRIRTSAMQTQPVRNVFVPLSAVQSA